MPPLRSWIRSANAGHTDFPIENLPLGVFRRAGAGAEGGRPRVGVAIGDRILDLRACVSAGLLAALASEVREAAAAPSLDPMMALGRAAGAAVRHIAGELLQSDGPGARSAERETAACLVPMTEAELLLPAAIGDFSDFYASRHHALNVGRLFHPERPLPANYGYLPLAYHGRASSIVVSGTPIVRPSGQVRTGRDRAPAFRPTAELDFEMELGFFVGGTNDLGRPVTIDEAEARLFGVVVVNDWSARDVQAWESQPLGPFLSKSFATTMSPWVVLMDALEPYRVPAAARQDGDPGPLPYLVSAENERRGGIDLFVEASIASADMRRGGLAALVLGRSAFRDQYWTAAQMVAHQGSNGCNLRAGDLIASGTISGGSDDAHGCLLELTRRGTQPVELPSGERRTYLADGDEVLMRAFTAREGLPHIGFGECRGQIVAAPARRVGQGRST